MNGCINEYHYVDIPCGKECPLRVDSIFNVVIVDNTINTKALVIYTYTCTCISTCLCTCKGVHVYVHVRTCIVTSNYVID